MSSFENLKLSEPVMKALASMGFEESTHIQDSTIPLALKGKDVIGQAPTGTGKTAAFGIPMIEICDNSPSIQAIVITPTRELAIQVSEELNKIGQFKGIRALPIYGGQEYKWQMKGLKEKPQIIVATPGRLMDHLTKQKSIKGNDVKMLVLDEADEMLDMGFIDDIYAVMEKLPAERQTLLFSATMSPEIKKIAVELMKKPHIVGQESKKVKSPAISQHYVEVHESGKFEALCRILDTQCPDLAIVFVRTKVRVDELQEGLTRRGYAAVGLHGDMDQQRRNSIMKQFKNGKTQVLVATDVAARGLDISDVSHVFNFDIPRDPESYVHRIGRTGRAGKSGISITFVTFREIKLLKLIEQVSARRMERMEVPTLEEAIEEQQRKVIDSLREAAYGEDALRYRHLAEKLLNDNDSVTLVSAALTMLIKEPDKTPVVLTEPKQGGKKKGGFRRPRK
ncbi:DEAD/DEAH box helicase [Methanocella arvoryzae]|uniref:ATP-dependent RNA helicase n=1 Tax=Methanocella arvoryzae (strain DSM 22066 / NBRC 105507 / MRE50) TaxID=351160 RepID=Q0W0G0_METAR|nr:DEAD/DEAH box helicase [Methanocella arvoryzae]CAJ38133.1 ATP-dependent RNA helicase [Methanocella arvoryzae MRE50]